ncbi:MAG: T9SS type A sorting domain-containing protein [Bacteroidota bacterium]|nr:T9SS type A sorting domain-containing protein [Bacteroidota bacterium]
MRKEMSIYHWITCLIILCINSSNGQFTLYRFDNVSEYVWREENKIASLAGKTDTLKSWDLIKDIELRAINDNGEVAGSYLLSNGHRRIFVIRCQKNKFTFDKYIRVGDYKAAGFQFVTDINNKGDIVFNILNETNGLSSARVLLWDEAKNKYSENSINASKEANESQVYSINDNRKMASQSMVYNILTQDQINVPIVGGIPNGFKLASNTLRGYVGTAGNATASREVAFPIAYFYNLRSELRGINRNGDVCGASYGAKGGNFFYKLTPMVRYEKTGEIGNIIDDMEGIALDINAAQHTCGVYYKTPGGSQRGFFYAPQAMDCDKKRGWVDINPDKETLPSKMTDEGIVVGTYLGKDGNRAFLWRLDTGADDVGCGSGTTENSDFAFQPKGKFYDFTDLSRPFYRGTKIMRYKTALSVSNSDFMIGTAIDSAGRTLAYRVKIPICIFGLVKKSYEWPVTTPFPIKDKLFDFGNILKYKITYLESPNGVVEENFTTMPKDIYSFKYLGKVKITIDYKCNPIQATENKDTLNILVFPSPIPRPFNSNSSAYKSRSKAKNRGSIPIIPKDSIANNAYCNGEGKSLLIIQSVRPFYDHLADENDLPLKIYENNPLGKEEVFTDMIPRFIEAYNQENPAKAIRYEILTDVDLLNKKGAIYYLKKFTNILVPDGQPDWFYTQLAKNSGKFEDYVKHGGTFICTGIAEMGSEKNVGKSDFPFPYASGLYQLNDAIKSGGGYILPFEFSYVPTKLIPNANNPNSGKVQDDFGLRKNLFEYQNPSGLDTFNIPKSPLFIKNLSNVKEFNNWGQLLRNELLYLKEFNSDILSNKNDQEQREVANKEVIKKIKKYFKFQGIEISDDDVEKFYRTSVSFVDYIGFFTKTQQPISFYPTEFSATGGVGGSANVSINNSGITYNIGKGKLIAFAQGLCWGALNDDIYYYTNNKLGGNNDTSFIFHKLLKSVIDYVGEQSYNRFITSPIQFEGYDLKNKMCFQTNLGIPNTDVNWKYYRVFDSPDNEGNVFKPIPDPNNFYFDGNKEWGAFGVIAEYQGRVDTVFFDVLKAGVYTYNYGLHPEINLSANTWKRNRFRTGQTTPGYSGNKPLLILLHGWQPDAVNKHSPNMGMINQELKSDSINPLIKKWADKGFEIIELDWVQYADNYNLNFQDHAYEALNILLFNQKWFKVAKKLIPEGWSVDNTVWLDQMNDINGIPWKKETPGLYAIPNANYNIDSVSLKSSIHKLFVAELNDLLSNYSGQEIQIMTHSMGTAVALRMVNELDISKKCIRKQINFCDMYYDGTTRSEDIDKLMTKARDQGYQLSHYKTTKLLEWSNQVFFFTDFTSSLIDINKSLEKYLKVYNRKVPTNQYDIAMFYEDVNLPKVTQNLLKHAEQAYSVLKNFVLTESVRARSATVHLDLNWKPSIIKNPFEIHGWAWIHFLYNIDQEEGKIRSVYDPNIIMPYRSMNPSTCKIMVEKYTPPNLPGIQLPMVQMQTVGGNTMTTSDDEHQFYFDFPNQELVRLPGQVLKVIPSLFPIGSVLDFLVNKVISLTENNVSQVTQDIFDRVWSGYDCKDSALVISRGIKNPSSGLYTYEKDSIFSTIDEVTFSPTVLQPLTTCGVKWYIKDKYDSLYFNLSNVNNKYKSNFVFDRFHRWGRVSTAFGFECTDGRKANPNEGDCNVLKKSSEVFDYGIWFLKTSVDADGKPVEEIRRYTKRDNMKDFYNPDKKTVLYIHGARSGAYLSGYRSKFLYDFQDEGMENAAKQWTDAGYNFAFFNYTQLADEDNVEDVEEKFYNKDKMRWRKSNGSFEDKRFLTTPGTNIKPYNIKDLLFQCLDSLGEIKQPMRVLGHGLGAQLAALAIKKVFDSDNSKADRLVLLDPYFPYGSKAYLNNDSSSGRTLKIIKELETSKVPVETYKSSKISSKKRNSDGTYIYAPYYMNEFRDSLIDRTAYVEMLTKGWELKIKIPISLNIKLNGNQDFPPIKHNHESSLVWYLLSMKGQTYDRDKIFMPDLISKAPLYNENGTKISNPNINPDYNINPIDGQSARSIRDTVFSYIMDKMYKKLVGGLKTTKLEDDQQTNLCICLKDLNEDVYPQKREMVWAINNSLLYTSGINNRYLLIKNPVKGTSDYIKKMLESNPEEVTSRPKPYSVRLSNANSNGTNYDTKGFLHIHPFTKEGRANVNPQLENLVIQDENQLISQIENDYKIFVFEYLMPKGLYCFPMPHFKNYKWYSTYTDAIIEKKIQNKWMVINPLENQSYSVFDSTGNPINEGYYLIGLYSSKGNTVQITNPSVANDNLKLISQNILYYLTEEGNKDNLNLNGKYIQMYPNYPSLWMIQHQPHDQYFGRNNWQEGGQMGPYTNITLYTPNRVAYQINQDEYKILEDFYSCLGINFGGDNGLYPAKYYKSKPQISSDEAIGGYPLSTTSAPNAGKPNIDQMEYKTVENDQVRAGKYNFKLNRIIDQRNASNWTNLANQTTLSDTNAQSFSGIYSSHLNAFKDLSSNLNATFIVRNSNTSALKWLLKMYRGAKYLPKPFSVKGKTIDIESYLNIENYSKGSNETGYSTDNCITVNVPIYGKVSKTCKINDDGCFESAGLASFDIRSIRGRGLIYPKDPEVAEGFPDLDEKYFCKLEKLILGKDSTKLQYVFPVPFFANPYQVGFFKDEIINKQFVTSTDGEGFVDNDKYFLTNQSGQLIKLKLFDASNNVLSNKSITSIINIISKIEAFEVTSTSNNLYYCSNTSIWKIEFKNRPVGLPSTNYAAYFVSKDGLPIWKDLNISPRVRKYYEYLLENCSQKESDFYDPTDFFEPTTINGVRKKLYRDKCYTFKTFNGFEYYSDYDLHGIYYASPLDIGTNNINTLVGKSWWPYGNDEVKRQAAQLISKYIHGSVNINSDEIKLSVPDGQFENEYNAMKIIVSSFASADAKQEIIEKLKNIGGKVFSTNEKEKPNDKNDLYNLVQHGPHDEWGDNNNYAVAEVNAGPQGKITIITPEKSLFNINSSLPSYSTFMQERFYNSLGISFESIYPRIHYGKNGENNTGSKLIYNSFKSDLCKYWSDGGTGTNGNKCEVKFEVSESGFPTAIECFGEIRAQIRNNNSLLNQSWESIISLCNGNASTVETCSQLFTQTSISNKLQDPTNQEDISKTVNSPFREVLLQPNPTNSNVSISSDFIEKGTYNIIIYDVKGATVYNSVKYIEENGNINWTIDIQNFEMGLYYVSLIKNYKNVKVIKLVKSY